MKKLISEFPKGEGKDCVTTQKTYTATPGFNRSASKPRGAVDTVMGMGERTDKGKGCNGELRRAWKAGIVESGVVPGSIEGERLVWMSGAGSAELTGLPCSLG